MGSDYLHLNWAPDGSAHCICVLIIPEKAIEEPGYIKTLHKSGSTDKHEFQALAQTAYYQHQDDELELLVADQSISIGRAGDTHYLDHGMVLFRERGGLIRAAVCQGQNPKKLLETAHRFCTRWVRLDI